MSVLFRWAGVGAGVVAGVVTARAGGLGTGLLLAAPLFGLCALIGVLAGELAVRAPKGPTRTATLDTRRIRDYLPRHLGRAVAATGGLLLVVVAATTAAGSPDDQGRAGRSISRQCTPDMVTSHGPWPGLYYTGRLAAVVLIGLLLAYLALRTIVQRPRAGEVAGDDARRRRSARTVTGAVGILLAIPLAGVSVIAAGGLRGIDCAPPSWTVAAWGLLAFGPVALAIVVWCAAAVITPTDPRTP